MKMRSDFSKVVTYAQADGQTDMEKLTIFVVNAPDTEKSRNTGICNYFETLLYVTGVIINLPSLPPYVSCEKNRIATLRM
jgi:hypothetical protein